MNYFLRPLHLSDNAPLAAIIRQVSAEFGLAPEAGFAVADPILDDLYAVYSQPRACYWVICDEQGTVLGGGGASALMGDSEQLEVQKMYFSAQIRGQGFAKQILQHIFEFARSQQFKACYLETTASLWQAVKLYEKLGFQHLSAPLGQTGHSHACEIWMQKIL